MKYLDGLEYLYLVFRCTTTVIWFYHLLLAMCVRLTDRSQQSLKEARIRLNREG